MFSCMFEDLVKKQPDMANSRHFDDAHSPQTIQIGT